MSTELLLLFVMAPIAIVALTAAAVFFWLNVVNAMRVIYDERGTVCFGWKFSKKVFMPACIDVDGPEAIAYGGASMLFGLVMTLGCASIGYLSINAFDIRLSTYSVAFVVFLICSRPIMRALVQRSPAREQIERVLV
jgi:hypothetical protein